MPALHVGTLLLSVSLSLPPWGNLEILVIRSSLGEDWPECRIRCTLQHSTEVRWVF